MAVLLIAGAANSCAAEVRWDEWGVPHIAAADSGDALFALGWTQMRAHANLELRLVARNRGIAAQVLGAGDKDAELKSDSWVRLMGVAPLAQTWLAAQTPVEKDILERFVAGLNGYAQAHPDDIDPALKNVLPITQADVLARVIDVTLFTLAVNQDSLMSVVGRWLKGEEPAPISNAAAAGSNGWAIGSRRASKAKAMLLVNPHLPWTDKTRLFEADIRYPGMHVYGATFVGFPFVAMGFNGALGWTHTVNPMHGFYLYELQARANGYAWNGQSRAFDTRVETIAIRGSNADTSPPTTLHVRNAVQGPVVAEQGDRLLALWVPGRDSPHLIGQYWAMARAQKFAEFQTALQAEQAALFSIIYADRDGHIYYNFGGRNPTGANPTQRGRTVLDGRTAGTLWTGVLPLEQLPHLLDPSTGWIQSANDPPWTATWPSPLQEKNFPVGLIDSSGDFTNLRAQQVINQLSVDRRLSLDDLIVLKHSTHVELADRVLDDLISAGKRSNDVDARSASEVLAQWDRNIDASSRGAGLFVAWVLLTPGDDSVFAHPFDAAQPLNTPRGLRDLDDAARRLGKAARILKQLQGRLDAPWGDSHKLRQGELSLPANGASDPLGMPRSTSYVLDPAHRDFKATGGDSFVAAVAFGSTISARGLLSYGNFSQPPPAGVKDQFALYAQKQLRAIAFDPDPHAIAVLTEHPLAPANQVH